MFGSVTYYSDHTLYERPSDKGFFFKKELFVLYANLNIKCLAFDITYMPAQFSYIIHLVLDI